MSVKVKYKGEQILSLNTDTEKALSTMGQYCEDDITIENVQDGGITPSGSIAITENGTYDVTEYAEADVNVSGGTEITDGIVVTSRNANGEPLAVDIYGTIIYKYTLGSGVIRSYGFPLWTVTSCRFVDQVVEIKAEAFRLAGLSSVELPISVVTMGANVFRQSDLKTVKAPFSFNYSGSQGLYCFYDCNKLESVELGSEENSVKITQNQLFRTSAAFTITVWAIGSTIDTTIANIHSGAPNATIIIKASEDTTYGGETYLAGETIITSAPT